MKVLRPLLSTAIGIGLVFSAGFPAEAAPQAPAPPPYPTSVLADSPTSYFRFNETTGLSAADSSGNGNDGSYVSGDTLGVTGALLSDTNHAFNAVNRTVVFQQSGDTLPAGDTARTVEIWFNYQCCNTPFDLVQYGDVAGGHGVEIGIGDSASTIGLTASGTTVSANTLGDTAHGWHLVDVTYNGSTATIYEDGQAIGSGTLGSAGTVLPGQGLKVSANSASMGIDELAVYPTALSASRVDAHWSSGANSLGLGECAPTPTGLYPTTILGDSPLAYYRLDDLGASSVDRVAYDSSASCENGAYRTGDTSLAGALPGAADPGVAASVRDVTLYANDAQLPSGTASRTLETWINYNCCNSPLSLMQYGDVAGGHGFIVTLADSAVGLSVGDGSNSVSATTLGDIRHGWHLVDVTYDGSTGTTEIYQDGQVIGGGTLSLIGTVLPGQGLHLSANAANAGFDEAAVYGAALSPDQIATHWSAGQTAHGAGPCASAPTAPYATTVLADNPALYYRMSDLHSGAQDSLALDASSHCRNAAYVNHPQISTGALLGDADTAVAADLRDVVLLQSGNSLPSADQPRTLEAWVEYQCCNSPFDLFRYGDVAGGHGFEVTVSDSANTLTVNNGTNTVNATTIGDFQHGWHLVDVTYDGTAAAIYEDGQLIGSGTLGPSGTVLPGQGFQVGSNATGMGIDDVAVYSAKLSSTRIDAHFKAQYDTPPGSSLLAGKATIGGGGAAQGARVQACPTSGAACFVDADPLDSLGDFHLVVPNDTYTLTIYPPAASSSGPQVIGPLTVPPSVTDLSATFSPPGGLPSGATFSSPSTGTQSNTVPSVNWGEGSTFTVTACTDGAGVLYLQATNTSTGQSEIRAVDMVESPAGSGTYVGHLPPLAPEHGLGSLDPQITCPGHTSVVPEGGPPAGGTPVLIGGSGFTGATGVTFGSTAATSFTVVTDTLIAATVPAGSGSVAVKVTTPAPATIDVGNYNYFDVTGVSPSSGPSAGGTTVTINGDGFNDVRGVLFGVEPATNVQIISPTQIQVTSPIGIGTANVQVVNGLAASPTTAATRFTFTGGPPGSDAIVEPFGGGDNDTTVYVNQITNYCASNDCAGAGLTGVVQNAGEWTTPIATEPGENPEGVPPLDFVGLGEAGLGLACIVPVSDVFCGVLAVVSFGTAVYTLLHDAHVCVKILGWDVFGGCQVFIDPSGTVLDGNGNPISGASATILSGPGAQGPFTAVAANSGIIQPAVNPETTGNTGAFDWDALAGYYKISATAPNCHKPGDAGTPAVSTAPFLIPPPAVGLVLTMTCTSQPPPPAPTVDGLVAATGPASGGNTISITGTGLGGATAVKFGSKAAPQVQVLGPFALSVVVPAGSGAADVTVTTPGGTSTTSASDVYTYLAPAVVAGGPTITDVSPSTGPLSGGTLVTITGTHLGNATGVAFGGTPATSITEVSPTEVHAVAPSAAFPSRVDVTVTTPVGTSPTSAADAFTYGNPPAATATSTTVTASATSVVPGSPVTFSAKVAPTDGGGGVGFFVGASQTPIAGCANRPLTLTNGHYTATCTTSGLSAGAHSVSAVYAGDTNYAASAGATSIAVMTAKVVAPTAAFQLTKTIAVRYAATAGGHPASYDVRYRVASWNHPSGAYLSPASLQHRTSTSASIAGAPGHEYCVGVRVRDSSGHVSAFTADRCTTLPLDDRSLHASAGWTRSTGSGDYLHTISTATAKGRTLTASGARFTQIAVVATTCSGCGSLQVVVGGHVLATINLAARGTHTERLFVLARHALRTATVVLRVASSGKKVTVDGLGFAAT